MNIQSNVVFLIGYAGHAYSVIDTAIKNSFEPEGYFELLKKNSNPFNLKYLGNELNYDFSNFNSIIFPSIGNNQLRMKAHQFIQEKKLRECSFIHPSTILGFEVKIGKSTFVSSGTIINTLGKIGDACILNTGCVIDHEAVIENYVHIGPGSTLAGNVKIGEGTFIGANCTIIQGVSIGRNCIIGAGSVVLKNVEDNSVIVGNPGKFLRKND